MSLILQSMQIRERCKSGELKRELQNQAMNEHKVVRRFGQYPFAASAFPAAIILPQKDKMAFSMLPSQYRLYVD